MANIFIARSLHMYSEYYDSTSPSISNQIILPVHTLTDFMSKFNNTEQYFLVKLINTETKQVVIATIGTPHFDDRDTIYVPQWLLDAIGCTGECDTPVKILKLRKRLPLASSITIKPLDPMMFQVDLVKCFEKVLENITVLQEGLTIPVIIPELDNYQSIAYIEKVEPEKIVLSHDGDINVEFIRDFEEKDTSNEHTNAIMNIPEPERVLEPVVNNSSVPNWGIENLSQLTTHNANQMDSEETIQERRRRIRESWANRFTQIQNTSSTR